VGFLFYYQNIFSKSSRILWYHFLTVLSVQMHIFLYIFYNWYLKSYGILLLLDEVCNDPMYSEMLNGIITEKEVLDAIKGLKNNKAPGSDKLINGFLFYYQNICSKSSRILSYHFLTVLSVQMHIFLYIFYNLYQLIS
jgi:hypothetical protein